VAGNDREHPYRKPSAESAETPTEGVSVEPAEPPAPEKPPDATSGQLSEGPPVNGTADPRQSPEPGSDGDSQAEATAVPLTETESSAQCDLSEVEAGTDDKARSGGVAGSSCDGPCSPETHAEPSPGITAEPPVKDAPPEVEKGGPSPAATPEPAPQPTDDAAAQPSSPDVTPRKRKLPSRKNITELEKLHMHSECHRTEILGTKLRHTPCRMSDAAAAAAAAIQPPVLVPNGDADPEKPPPKKKRKLMLLPRRGLGVRLGGKRPRYAESPEDSSESEGPPHLEPEAPLMVAKWKARGGGKGTLRGRGGVVGGRGRGKAGIRGRSVLRGRGMSVSGRGVSRGRGKGVGKGGALRSGKDSGSPRGRGSPRARGRGGVGGRGGGRGKKLMSASTLPTSSTSSSEEDERVGATFASQVSGPRPRSAATRFDTLRATVVDWIARRSAAAGD